MAHRKGRSVLTGAGIVLGVAILFGVLVSNATTQAGVDRLLEDFTGRADVVANGIGVFDATLPNGAIERLRALPDVKDVVGWFDISTGLPDRHWEREPDDPAEVTVSGIVPDEAKKIQTFTFIEGRFPQPGSDEIVVSETMRSELGFGFGDRVPVRGKAQTRDLTVVGVLEREGAGRAGRGSVTYASLDTVRALAGEGPNVFDSASLVLTTDENIDGWLDANQDKVEGVRLLNAENLAAGFRQFLQVFGTFLTFFAGITLFVGAFLIYLTLSMAVIERTRMYGTLRALGASRRQVRRVVLTEALALGFLSTLVGLLLGLGLAVGLLRLIASLFELDLPGLVVTPGAVIAAIVVGLIVTTLSSLIPAMRAGRLAPVEAMKGDYLRDTRLGRAWIAGAIILAVSVIVDFLTVGRLSGSVIGILLGAVLLVPLVLRPLAALLGRLTNRLARGVGDVAVLHLAKERSRSAYTLALVMVVMAMLFATGGLYLSVRAAMNEIIDRQFGADLFIGPVGDRFMAAGDGLGDLRTKLDDRNDIGIVSPLYLGETSAVGADGERTFFFVRTVEPETYFDVSSYFWKDGEDDAGKQALVRGDAVLVSDTVARYLGVNRGDTITMQTRKGKVPFEVAATYISPPGPPEVSVGLKDGARYFAARDPFGYVANVAPGSDPRIVARDVERAFPDRVRTETVIDVKEEASGQIASYFRIVYAILLVAAIVGLLGLANTLAMSVLQRFREIGILRAIGVTRSQTGRMVLVESATMGLTAFILSVPLGWLLTFLVIRSTSQGFGFSMPTIYPWLWIPVVAAFGLVMSTVAAIAPGRRAARLEVVTALQYE